MSDLYYIISEEVFTRFPGYVRGVVLAYGVSNGPSPAELMALLRAVEGAVSRQSDLANLTEHPRIKSWREAFRLFGAKPSEYRPSIEGLARRALRGEPLPSINALVDIGNVISLRYLVPAGAHAIDDVTEDLTLRAATGTEVFIALGSGAVEHPEPGEIIFAQGDRVLTRRWVWRQGRDTLVRPETTAVEYNVDGLPPVTPDEVAAICEETGYLVERFCGGRTGYEVLSPANPFLKLALK